jgi:hypothetical protein
VLERPYARLWEAGLVEATVKSCTISGIATLPVAGDS